MADKLAANVLKLVVVVTILEESCAVKTKYLYFFKEVLTAGGSQNVAKTISFLSFPFESLSQKFQPGRQNI